MRCRGAAPYDWYHGIVVWVLEKSGEGGPVNAIEKARSVLDAIEKMASEVPGIKNVWLKSIKVQGVFSEKQPDGSFKPRPYTDAFVIEFEDQAAFDKYTNHPAHKAFEELYIPLRGHSGTHDITN